MKNKIISIVIILITLIGLIASFQEIKTRDKETELLKKKIDSLINESNLKTVSLTNKIDSLIAVKRKKIYVPYKKKNYNSRNVDDAINILTEYVYKSSKTEDSK